MREFTGTTEAAGSAILGAPFWTEGKSINGVYIRTWDSKVGECFEFAAIPGQPKPIAVIGTDGKVTEKGSSGSKEMSLDKWSIGALKGFGMALQVLEEQGIRFQFRDQVEVICTGIQAATQPGMDAMIMFKIVVRR